MNEHPLLIQEMIATGYRSIEVEVPGFDTLITQIADRCDSFIDEFSQPATDLGIEALRVFFPEADFEIDQQHEETTLSGWPRGVLAERHVWAVGPGVGDKRPYARIRLRHAMMNPRDGEGYSFYVNLWSVTKPHHEKATIRVANNCGLPAAIHISGTDLTDQELKGLIAATGKVFNCIPVEGKRIG